ncbi:dihydroorotase [Lacticaseibacillus songhuajiangensis]|jgi:dihydroorotase|uniref:dihydroorotase n=1 Tax=Lacticaseibacillus songhuajiangensis TaxID=1296539 RepID=UPI000F79E90A|nr:dihydroorotase [Lacticaseibacillus songhuajiangensis]
MDYLLKNGHIYVNGEFFDGDILLQNGRISALGVDLSADNATVLDLQGKLVTPGLVDLHVHFRDPGQTAKETIATGSRAAARGGFTTVAAMPNVEPVPDNAARIKHMLDRNAQEAVVHVKQYSSITINRAAGDCVDFAAVKAAGAVAVSNDGNGIQSAKTMWEALLGCKAAGLPLAEHIEEDSLKYGGVMTAGKRAQELGLPGAPTVVETSQLGRDLALAKAAGAHYHACHISTADSIKMVRAAKADGVQVTAEATPHHLLLADSDIPDNQDTNFKMNPPLRSAADRDALVRALADGTIDIVATDHAPHTADEKAAGFCGAPNGITGSETCFAALYTDLVLTGKLPLTRLLDVLTSAPARIFELDCGHILPGGAADIAVFDLAHAETVCAADFASKGKNSPWVGRELRGNCYCTFVDGKLVYKQEEKA